MRQLAEDIAVLVTAYLVRRFVVRVLDRWELDAALEQIEAHANGR